MVKSEGFGDLIRKYRTEMRLPLRKVAAFLDIDQAILSKIERGKRKANREQVMKLAGFFGVEKDHLIVSWLSDRIAKELADEKNSLEILKVAEEKILYKTTERNVLPDKVLNIRNILKEYTTVEKAWLFGSFARGENTPVSDLDVLIDVPVETRFTLFDIAEIQENLTHAININVDVVMLRALAPKVKKRIQKDLQLIYEARENRE
jgi:predicted nucleotidyltransferase/plasmid maintenance system antidote protein VapI